ncbi:hypothetical protein EMCG_09462 [[Emmonsia] crescens]|uniref:Uncharacterized protein n=1 Tax=[Emmonsia] crescens TaxID=73230 RepID=A0A0G2I2M6_9EURO|nr:hypothetical protein EMCG_09462 [Emmonsia crescens UAMH 3008]
MPDTETHSAPETPANSHVEPNELPPSNASPPKPSKAVLRSFTTLSNALEEEEDMRAELQYARKRAVFYTELESQEKEIKSLVAAHCRLAPDQIHIPKMVEADKITWLHGSFNACLPLYLNHAGGFLPATMAFRVPLPYKIGEEYYPGNGEEKVLSEAATYIWISMNCPDIPIPKLRGFGVPGGLSLFDPKFLPLWQRIKSYVWRFFCRLYCASAPEYIPQRRTTLLEHGYLLIDWIETENSQMLSNTFSSPHTETQTQNLY